MIKKLFLISLILFINILTYAQCSSCPSVPSCSGGNGAVSNNANINSGDTYWYDSSGDTYSINFGGGTLIVCGDLTISSINFNGASTIYVASGGKLTINSGFNFNGGANIYNYGTLTINGDINLQNSNNKLSNCSSSASLNINGKLSINSSTSEFNNFGIADITETVLQGGASGLFCLSQNSETYLDEFTNNYTNSVVAPSGQACLSYSGDALLNNDLSPDVDLLICQQSGATTSGSASFGSATVISNCTSCSSALPVELINFDANPEDNIVKIYWTTATEINNDYFVIERSKDGNNFEQITVVQGAGNSSVILNYVYYDEHPYSELSYYRLKQVDIDGQFSYSSMKAVYFAPFSLINVYPNPSKDFINIVVGSPDDIDVEILIFNNLGQRILYNNERIKKGFYTINIDISNFSAGHYFFKITTPYEEHIENEFVKYNSSVKDNW